MDATASQLANQTSRPAARLQTESFRASRPLRVGSDVPDAPCPIYLAGIVQEGFGRGSKDLGCPTGNYIYSITVYA